MAGIDQQSSFSLTLDGVHRLKIGDHQIMGDPFEELGYVTIEAINIHDLHPKRFTIWFDNRVDEEGQSGLTIGDIAQFGLALASWAADRKGESIDKAEAMLKEISDA